MFNFPTVLECSIHPDFDYCESIYFTDYSGNATFYYL